MPPTLIIGPRTMEHLDGYLAADGINPTNSFSFNDALERVKANFVFCQNIP